MSILDKLTPHPPQTEPGVGKDASPQPHPKAALTKEEQELLGRAKAFIVPALKECGITLSTAEVTPVAARVADFVVSDKEIAGELAEEESQEEAS